MLHFFVLSVPVSSSGMAFSLIDSFVSAQSSPAAGKPAFAPASTTLALNAPAPHRRLANASEMSRNRYYGDYPDPKRATTDMIDLLDTRESPEITDRNFLMTDDGETAEREVRGMKYDPQIASSETRMDNGLQELSVSGPESEISFDDSPSIHVSEFEGLPYTRGKEMPWFVNEDYEPPITRTHFMLQPEMGDDDGNANGDNERKSPRLSDVFIQDQKGDEFSEDGSLDKQKYTDGNPEEERSPRVLEAGHFIDDDEGNVEIQEMENGLRYHSHVLNFLQKDISAEPKPPDKSNINDIKENEKKIDEYKDHVVIKKPRANRARRDEDDDDEDMYVKNNPPSIPYYAYKLNPRSDVAEAAAEASSAALESRRDPATRKSKIMMMENNGDKFSVASSSSVFPHEAEVKEHIQHHAFGKKKNSPTTLIELMGNNNYHPGFWGDSRLEQEAAYLSNVHEEEEYSRNSNVKAEEEGYGGRRMLMQMGEKAETDDANGYAKKQKKNGDDLKMSKKNNVIARHRHDRNLIQEVVRIGIGGVMEKEINLAQEKHASEILAKVDTHKLQALLDDVSDSVEGIVDKFRKQGAYLNRLRDTIGVRNLEELITMMVHKKIQAPLMGMFVKASDANGIDDFLKRARHQMSQPIGPAESNVSILKKLGANPDNDCPIIFPISSFNVFPTKKTNWAPTKYMSLEYDCAGFNNVRMSFEIAINLAYMTGRTFIIPPPHNWYNGECPEKGCSLLDIYDIKELKKAYPVITAREYFDNNVSYKLFTASMRSKNDWDGITDEYLLDEILSNWSKAKNALTGDGIHADKTYIHIPNKCRNDPPVRVFAQLEYYFRDLGDEGIKELQRRVFHGFRFRKDVINSAIKSMGKIGIDKCGTYCAAHFRRGDFLWALKKGKEMNHPISWFKDSIKNTCKKGERLYLLTNPDEDTSYFNELKKDFDVHFMKYDSDKHVEWHKAVDMLTGACAREFLGTPYSTFSNYIQYLRGYLHTYANGVDAEEHYLDHSNGSKLGHPELVMFRKDMLEGDWSTVFTSRYEDLDNPLAPGVCYDRFGNKIYSEKEMYATDIITT